MTTLSETTHLDGDGPAPSAIEPAALASDDLAGDHLHFDRRARVWRGHVDAIAPGRLEQGDRRSGATDRAA